MFILATILTWTLSAFIVSLLPKEYIKEQENKIYNILIEYYHDNWFIALVVRVALIIGYGYIKVVKFLQLLYK